MTEKWIITGASGSWVVNEQEVAQIAGSQTVAEMKAEASTNSPNRSFRKVGQTKIEFAEVK